MHTAIKSVKLTPQQEQKWEETRVAVQWHQPAFTHIWYQLLSDNGHALFTKDASICPIAATDGKNLILNPDTFFTFPINQRVFIVVHEILHCIYNHPGQMYHFQKRGEVGYSDGKSIEYDGQLYNKAADYVINDLIQDSKIGELPKKDGANIVLWDKRIATGKDSVIDIYAKLHKKQPPNGGGFDVLLPPGAGQGKDPNQASSERNETQWATEIAAAANAARAQGKLPAALEHAFNEILNPKVDWRDKIQGLFARKVGSGSYNWRKPDRQLIVRDIYAPGRSGFGAGCVVVAVDTSGSIGETELDMFFAEMAGILEDVKPKRLVVMWCDAKVHRVDEAEEPGDLNVIRAKGAPGRGGTSFVPVFEEIKSMGLEPDALVYLTDGLGTFPEHAPNYPTIWGNIHDGSQYPFGDVVDVPKAA